MSDYAALRKENAKVLRKLAKEVDLTRPVTIDFAATFPTRAQAKDAVSYINRRAHRGGIRARVVEVDGDFDCALSVRMVPDVNDITDIESVLAEASDRFDGYETMWDFAPDQ